MGLLTQFSLLLWKNFTLRKRQKVRLLVEIVWPLFLFVILVTVRTTTKPSNKGQCHYPNKAMPSAGVLPWLQSMMCNIDNPCSNYPTPGETPGQVNNFNESIISEILINLQKFLLELPEEDPAGPLSKFLFMENLLNSTAEAVNSLDFQNDPINSFSMLLCGKEPSSNSTFKFPTSKQTDNINSSFQNSQDSVSCEPVLMMLEDQRGEKVRIVEVLVMWSETKAAHHINNSGRT